MATIADRCVRLGLPGAEEQPSLYRLCRQWVQNDPDLGEPLAEVGAAGHKRPLCSAGSLHRQRVHGAWPPIKWYMHAWARMREALLANHMAKHSPPLPAPPPPPMQPLPTSKLPPLPPLSEEAAAVVRLPPPQEPPLPGATEAGGGGAEAGAAAAAAGSTPPEVADLLKHHQQHWKAVRQHAQARAAAAQQRHGQRLQAVLALGGSGVGAGSGALPVPMQH